MGLLGERKLWKQQKWLGHRKRHTPQVRWGQSNYERHRGWSREFRSDPLKWALAKEWGVEGKAEQRESGSGAASCLGNRCSNPWTDRSYSHIRICAGFTTSIVRKMPSQHTWTSCPALYRLGICGESYCKEILDIKEKSALEALLYRTELVSVIIIY